ncbi:CRISPR system precrRNA processing endoribonuclease RAMP protein Cas6 [Persephonella sp.]
MFNFEFSVIKYRFEALSSFTTPYFLGSTFRGILGRKLKKIVCIKPGTECQVCEFRMTCPYTVIFETESFLNKPSRYIMRPPFEKKELQEGDSLELEITLLGETANYWEFISQAFAGILNLGKDRYLKTVGMEFYHPFEGIYYPVKSFIPRFEAYHFLEFITGQKKLDIKIYPTSLKFGGEFVSYKTFNKETLIKAIVSRISVVANHYGLKTGKIFIDPSAIELENLKTRAVPMKRWSNRKKIHMVIPAFEAEFTISGEINAIYPYLTTVELINLGKSVSFGLGRIDIL